MFSIEARTTSRVPMHILDPLDESVSMSDSRQTVADCNDGGANASDKGREGFLNMPLLDVLFFFLLLVCL